MYYDQHQSFLQGCSSWLYNGYNIADGSLHLDNVSILQSPVSGCLMLNASNVSLSKSVLVWQISSHPPWLVPDPFSSLTSVLPMSSCTVIIDWTATASHIHWTILLWWKHLLYIDSSIWSSNPGLFSLRYTPGCNHSLPQANKSQFCLQYKYALPPSDCHNSLIC